jgi:hypothetical protein
MTKFRYENDENKNDRNHALRFLKYDVEDDQYLRIFGGIAELIRTSEQVCESADCRDDEAIIDREADYLEELIGISFVLLQAKIRRVTSSTLKLCKVMKGQGVELEELSSREKILSIGEDLESQQLRPAQLAWDIGNYYKHRDEWPDAVWYYEPLAAQEPKKQPVDRATEMGRKTRRVVEGLGVVEGSTGNMRTIYESLGVCPYSDCRRLAYEIQRWAEQVLECAETSVRRTE